MKLYNLQRSKVDSSTFASWSPVRSYIAREISKMKTNISIFFFSFLLISVQYLSVVVLCASQDFDFFYFVQQWPGAYCDSRRGCCFPTDGKPIADFTVHGLWPNNNDGSYPTNCDSTSAYDQSKVSDLMSSMHKYWPTLACPSSSGSSFWAHEWNKHGTCAESLMDENAYFSKALELRNQANLLASLESANIKPDDGFYSIDEIKDAMKSSTGFEPFIECNKDSQGNSQLYQVYLCVSKEGEYIECPVMPHSHVRCGQKIQFPQWGTATSRDEL